MAETTLHACTYHIELLACAGQQLGSEEGEDGRQDGGVSWETDMRGRDGVEVDWGDDLEEPALVQNAISWR